MVAIVFVSLIPLIVVAVSVPLCLVDAAWVRRLDRVSVALPFATALALGLLGCRTLPCPNCAKDPWPRASWFGRPPLDCANCGARLVTGSEIAEYERNARSERLLTPATRLICGLGAAWAVGACYAQHSGLLGAEVPSLAADLAVLALGATFLVMAATGLPRSWFQR
jgi:hypothetical protein